jgi:hypothetical protein
MSNSYPLHEGVRIPDIETGEKLGSNPLVFWVLEKIANCAVSSFLEAMCGHRADPPYQGKIKEDLLFGTWAGTRVRYLVAAGNTERSSRIGSHLLS